MNVASATPSEVARHHAFSQMREFVLPLWLGVVLVVVATRTVIGYVNEFDTSMWSSMTPSTKMFLGIVGIIVTPVIMPWYIASGMTRRDFVHAVVIVLAGMALISSTVMMAGFGVEAAIYDAAGIGSALDNIDVYGSVGRATIVFTSFLLLFAAWFCSGWLIGAGYYRYGGIVGTLLLPVMLIPVSISEYLIAIDWGWDPTDASGAVGIYMSIPGRVSGDVELPFVFGAMVVGIVIAAAVRLGYQFLRTVPIK